ncbi:pilin [Patescibacteria group bacterium]
MSKNKKIFLSIVICGLLLIPIFVFATDKGVLVNPIGGTKANPKGTIEIATIIGQVIKAVLGIVGSIALLMFLYGGFLWLTSRGNEQNITKGKNVLIWATIGLTVIFLSYILVGFVIDALTGKTGPSISQEDLESTVCCYQCINNKASNPTITELQGCTTGIWNDPIGGGCSPDGGAC